MTTKIYLPGTSEQVPDGVFSPALLAENPPNGAQGRKQVGFDIVVSS